MLTTNTPLNSTSDTADKFDLDLEVNQNGDEDQFITSLRIDDWNRFRGQEKVKESLSIVLQAAKERNEAVDHILFYGPPGLGKTTLSHLIAKEMNAQLTVTSGTALAKSSDLASILTNLQHKDILFIDEIHRLPKPVEELLYTAMEDFALDIVIGKGPSARTVRLDLPQFTLVGATTRFGSLSAPFRDRFGVIHRMEYYQPAELTSIIEEAAKTLKINIDSESKLALAKRSRGTPRIALKLLKRVRDFAQIRNNSEITPTSVEQALELMSIDALGLTHNDHFYLHTIITKHNGGPIGLSTIAAALSEDSITIEEVIEPYLLQVGFIAKTPQGRVVTESAYSHLQLKK
jgi:Holliday junction DNA helicase RuvB